MKERREELRLAAEERVELEAAEGSSFSAFARVPSHQIRTSGEHQAQ